jgi:hypothetical protein
MERELARSIGNESMAHLRQTLIAILATMQATES